MEYATEEQQLESIKNWIKKNSNKLSWGLLIFSLSFGGAYYWNHHQAVLQEQASDQYLSLLVGVEKNEKETIESRGKYLKEHFPHSVYATLGSFILATKAVNDKNYEAATQDLKWVLDNGKQPKFKSLARIRLMRLLLAENKLDEALKYYNEKEADGFLTLMNELKGDILFQQKNLHEARVAYEKALKAAPEEGLHGILLKMKLNELGAKVTETQQDKLGNSEASLL